MQSFVLGPLLVPLLCLQAAVVAPPWADPRTNPCAARPGGWQLLHWPADNQCYRIFTRGAPCPATMELGPGLAGQGAQCRCPPRWAQSPRDAECYLLYARGPCEAGQFFAPVQDKPDNSSRSGRRWGMCRNVETCLPDDHVFWPRDGQCYPRLARGPCPRGELLTRSSGTTAMGECRCASRGDLAPFYWAPTQTCHEHYTRGPCEQQGHLFLPGPRCGCHSDLPNYHDPSGLCYQIGGLAPCLPGQQFLLGTNSSMHAACRCKPGLVPWRADGACYRLYTRGPCQRGHILVSESVCAPIPCRHGRLYFPAGPACYKVGTRGPCPHGQLVLFEPVRISVDGISHRGMCGCSGPGCNEEAVATQTVRPTSSAPCDAGAGLVRVDGDCHPLYAQGTCPRGEWLVPDIEGGMEARCDCRPEYKRLNETCQSPTVTLARFLNLNAEQASTEEQGFDNDREEAIGDLTASADILT